MNTHGRPINTEQLAVELTAASVPFNFLGTSGDEVFTYDANNEIVDLPPEAQPIMDAHVPIPPGASYAEREREEALTLLIQAAPADPTIAALLKVVYGGS